MQIKKTADGGLCLTLSQHELTTLSDLVTTSLNMHTHVEVTVDKNLFSDIPDALPSNQLTEDEIYKNFHVKSRAFFSELRHTYGTGVWVDSKDAKFQEIRHKHLIYNFNSSIEILQERKALDVRHALHSRQWLIKFLW